MKRWCFLSICMFVFAGCDDTQIPSRSGGMSPVAEAITGMGAAEELQGNRSHVPEATPKAEEPKTEVVEIERGFTGKGQYGQGGGEKPSDIITVPVGELFAVRERMFLMQLKHTEDLYKANNDNQMPKTQEEYMEKIIKDGMLKLPDLPDGQEYFYDPEEKQLKIKKPR